MTCWVLHDQSMFRVITSHESPGAGYTPSERCAPLECPDFEFRPYPLTYRVKREDSSPVPLTKSVSSANSETPRRTPSFSANNTNAASTSPPQRQGPAAGETKLTESLSRTSSTNVKKEGVKDTAAGTLNSNPKKEHEVVQLGPSPVLPENTKRNFATTSVVTSETNPIDLIDDKSKEAVLPTEPSPATPTPPAAIAINFVNSNVFERTASSLSNATQQPTTENATTENESTTTLTTAPVISATKLLMLKATRSKEDIEKEKELKKTKPKPKVSAQGDETTAKKEKRPRQPKATSAKQKKTSGPSVPTSSGLLDDESDDSNNESPEATPVKHKTQHQEKPKNSPKSEPKKEPQQEQLQTNDSAMQHEDITTVTLPVVHSPTSTPQTSDVKEQPVAPQKVSSVVAPPATTGNKTPTITTTSPSTAVRRVMVTKTVLTPQGEWISNDEYVWLDSEGNEVAAPPQSQSPPRSLTTVSNMFGKRESQRDDENAKKPKTVEKPNNKEKAEKKPETKKPNETQQKTLASWFKK